MRIVERNVKTIVLEGVGPGLTAEKLAGALYQISGKPTLSKIKQNVDGSFNLEFEVVSHDPS